MLSCKQVMEKSSAWVDQELDWRDRWGMRLHLMMCGHCRRFTRQLKRLVTASEHLHGPAPDQQVEAVMARLLIDNPSDKDSPTQR